MPRNIELKARYPDLSGGHAVARSLPAPLFSIETQRDTYVHAPHGRLKLREIWIQPKDPQHANPPTDRMNQAAAEPDSTDCHITQLIAYNRADESAARPSDYSLVQLPASPLLRSMLIQSLGLAAEIVKYRTVYLYDNVRIHLDDVRQLGRFIEFEAIVDGACDDQAARKKLDRLISAFAIASDQILARSYSDLLQDARVVTGVPR